MVLRTPTRSRWPFFHRLVLRILAIPGLAALGTTTPFIAASSAAAAGGIGQADKPHKDHDREIIVYGTRNRIRLPDRLAIAPDLAQGRARHGARAETFVRCMKFLDPELLHQAVDGVSGYSSSRFALGLLIQKNLGCYPDLSPVPPRYAIDLGTCQPATVLGQATDPFNVTECRAPYNYAALVRRVLKMYGGTLSLTRQQTFAPDVQARFNRREAKLSRLRRYDDETMFQIAVCMVRIEPQSAIDLVQARDLARQFQLEDRLIAGGGECIGQRNRIGVDPTQFRDYISDSLYRWIVASRGIDSLVPGYQ